VLGPLTEAGTVGHREPAMQAILGGGRAATVAGLTAGGLSVSLARSMGYFLGTPGGPDKHEWLEEVLGDGPLEWVKNKNAAAVATLGEPSEQEVYGKLLKILESKEKIPYVSKTGDYYYNFWQDHKHVKGIWRRTTLEEYRKPEPDWEIVLDVDALGKAEGKSWVWKGKVLLDEGEGTEKDLCIVKLSDGGADAVVCREFSLKNKGFVEEEAFTLPECKSTLAWKDRDTLLVGTDFPGRSDSMTDSGYPRVICEWKRGTPLSTAKEVYACKKEHIGAHAWVDHDHGETYEWHYTSLTFYTSEKFVKRYGHGAPEPVKLQVPEDDSPSTFGARNKSGGSFPNVPCVVVPSLSWQMIFHFVW
jgi:prolyl oligopeptidase